MTPFSVTVTGRAALGALWAAIWPLAGCLPDLPGAPASEQAAGAMAHYMPVGLWACADNSECVTGRLVVPDEPGPDDRVWLEVEHAPGHHLEWIGERVWLGWEPGPRTEERLARSERDVYFGELARASLAAGNLHPAVDGWNRVGPLLSLAASPRIEAGLPAAPAPTGPRVLLENPSFDDERRMLRIRREPVQIEGIEVALVRFERPVETARDHYVYQVRHYSRITGDFDGALEEVTVPRVAAPGPGRPPVSTVTEIEDSPLNDRGWYLLGEHDEDDAFHVQALEPRRLLERAPLATISGTSPRPPVGQGPLYHALDYATRGVWLDSGEEEGGIASVLTAPEVEEGDARTTWAPSPGWLTEHWDIGDRALVVHGRGSATGLPGEFLDLPGEALAPGQLGFGVARVVRDRFTGAPRFDIEYHQLLAHDPLGSISGASKWSAAMGSLARGWMFLRPVTDAVVSTPVLDRPYEFHVLGLGEEECAARDGELLAAGRCRIAFDPLERMLRELEIAAARYRVGDGTGAAGVAPASSVAQDAQQALLVALAQLRHEVNGDLVLSRWLREHEGDPTVGRWHELASFSEALRDLLVPYGRVQPAWLDEAGDRVLEESDRRLLAASEPLPQCSLGPELPVCELASPPTLYPRQALDTLLRVALEHGAQIWYLRSNQPGGTVLEGATLERPFAPVAPAVPAALVAAAPAAVE